MNIDKITKRAWIQGNIISFRKPEFKSALFDCEKVLVIKSEKNIKDLLIEQREEVIEEARHIVYKSESLSEAHQNLTKLLKNE